MKNTTIALVAILLMCGMTSCQKDGVYNPNKKIERLYRAYNDSYESYYDGYWHSNSSETPKYLRAIYNWDGSKLKSIDYYSRQGGLDWTADYTYEGRKVSRIDDYKNSEYMSFEYKWGKLTKVDYYYKGSLEGTCTFTHKGNKISKIDITFFDKKKGASLNTNFLQNTLFTVFQDNEVSKELCEQICSSNAKDGIETRTIELTWKGNNISEALITEGSYRSTLSFSYDKKRNPFYGFWALDEGPDVEGMPKNNIVSIRSVSSEGSDMEDYTYTYDGNWPTMKMSTSSYSGDDWRSTSTYYEYYEYKN
jgi:hypothetical protein